MADFKSLKPKNTVKVEIKNPQTDEVLEGAIIEVYTAQSSKFKSVKQAISFERMTISDPNEKQGVRDLYIKSFDIGNEIVKECIVSVDGIEDNGVPITLENIKTFLDDYSWVTDQLFNAMNNKDNFFLNIEKS